MKKKIKFIANVQKFCENFPENFRISWGMFEKIQRKIFKILRERWKRISRKSRVHFGENRENREWIFEKLSKKNGKFLYNYFWLNMGKFYENLKEMQENCYKKRHKVFGKRLIKFWGIFKEMLRKTDQM